MSRLDRNIVNKYIVHNINQRKPVEKKREHL